MAAKQTVRQVIVAILSDMTEVPASEIRTDVDISEYGVDSLLAVVIVEELNRHFEFQISELDLFANFSTIDEVTQYLAEKYPLTKQAEVEMV